MSNSPVHAGIITVLFNKSQSPTKYRFNYCSL